MAKLPFHTADQRKDTYGGIQADKYVAWFLPISNELLRVLKPTGTFVLNIKEKVVEGERIRQVCQKGTMQKLKTVKVDLFLETQNAEIHLFDLKTAKPISAISKISKGLY